MIGRTPALTATAGAGATTASLGTELPVVKQAIPFLEFPIAHFEISGTLVALSIGQVSILMASTFSVIGVTASLLRKRS
jgi:hypothetical protein